MPKTSVGGWLCGETYYKGQASVESLLKGKEASRGSEGTEVGGVEWACLNFLRKVLNIFPPQEPISITADDWGKNTLKTVKWAQGRD